MTENRHRLVGEKGADAVNPDTNQITNEHGTTANTPKGIESCSICVHEKETSLAPTDPCGWCFDNAGHKKLMWRRHFKK